MSLFVCAVQEGPSSVRHVLKESTRRTVEHFADVLLDSGRNV